MQVTLNVLCIHVYFRPKQIQQWIVKRLNGNIQHFSCWNYLWKVAKRCTIHDKLMLLMTHHVISSSQSPQVIDSEQLIIFACNWCRITYSTVQNLHKCYWWRTAYCKALQRKSIAKCISPEIASRLESPNYQTALSNAISSAKVMCDFVFLAVHQSVICDEGFQTLFSIWLFIG